MITDYFFTRSLLGLAMGLLLHAFKALLTAKRASKLPVSLNPFSYFAENWIESGFSFFAALSIWFMLPELVDAFPDQMRFIGLNHTTAHSYLTGFMCGFIGDSIADALGNRARAVYAKLGVETT